MNDRQIVIGIAVGAALMAMGLVRGPLSALLGWLTTGVENYQKQIHGLPPTLPARDGGMSHVRGQHWLAIAGAILIVLTLIAQSEG